MLIDQLFYKPSLGAISGIVNKKDKPSIVGFNSNKNKSLFPLANGPIIFTFHQKKNVMSLRNSTVSITQHQSCVESGHSTLSLANQGFEVRGS